MKKVLPIIIVVVLLLLGLGFFLITRNFSPTSVPSESTSEASQEPQSSASQKQSLRYLLGLGTSQMCEFSDNTSGSSGKVYVSAGKMRGDFATVVNGEVAASHMYSDGKTMYIWMDGSEMGFKSSIEVTGTPIPEPTGSQTQTKMDIDEEVDYNCQPWTADDSMFKLPANIEFKDLSAMMALPTGAMMPVEDDKCSACNSLSGDAKAQCLTALGCP